MNWADLWHRLGRPGDPPPYQPLLDALTAAALIQPDQSPDADDGDQAKVIYRMHPGIAEAIRVTATPGIQAATDTELAAFWRQVSLQAREQERGEVGQIIVYAGLAAAPYLLRLKDWDTAGAFLEQSLLRDGSPVTVQAALPALRAIADATQSPSDIAVLARALMTVDPVEAEALLRGALTQATADGDFQAAAGVAGVLGKVLMAAGKLHEALEFASQEAAAHTHQAGLGPWTRLGDQATQLQILGQMGEHRQVLDQIPALAAQMDQLPAAEGSNETLEPWNVRETILDVGRSSALALGEWQLCLDLNAANLASKRARGVSTHEITRFRYNDAGPLIRLRRLDEAEQILIECQQVYEDHGDLGRLARVVYLRADLEDMRGHLAAALAFQQTAIRFAYARPEPKDIGGHHLNLARYLGRTRSDAAAQRAHRLAAALIFELTGMTHNLAAACQTLASELHGDTSGEYLPSTLDEVIAVAEQTEGVRLRELITALQPDWQAAADALTQILQAAAETGPEQDRSINDVLQKLEPVIAATVAAAAGDTGAAAQLTAFLDHPAGTQEGAALVAVLRRIINGDRGDSLLQGLDPIYAAIVGQVLARLSPATGQSRTGAAMTRLTGSIATLDEATAVRVLADIADYQARLPDPAQLRTMEAGLREALATDPGLTGYTRPGAEASAGDLARATLQHLAATRTDLTEILTRTMDAPEHETRDPVTLTVAALVLIALQTEVRLTRSAQGRWTFTVHKHQMRDSSLGQVITKLVGYLTGSQ